MIKELGKDDTTLLRGNIFIFWALQTIHWHCQGERERDGEGEGGAEKQLSKVNVGGGWWWYEMITETV